MVPRGWGRWAGGLLFNGMEFQFEKVRKFWTWVAVTVAQQCERAHCYYTVRVKMVKVDNFMLCVTTISTFQKPNTLESFLVLPSRSEPTFRCPVSRNL